MMRARRGAQRWLCGIPRPSPFPRPPPESDASSPMSRAKAAWRALIVEARRQHLHHERQFGALTGRQMMNGAGHGSGLTATAGFGNPPLLVRPTLGFPPDEQAEVSPIRPLRTRFKKHRYGSKYLQVGAGCQGVKSRLRSRRLRRFYLAPANNSNIKEREPIQHETDKRLQNL